MHEYSIDINPKKIYFYLVIASFAVSMLLTSIINCLIDLIPIEITVSGTSFGSFGVLYTLFDKHIWKCKWLRKFGIVQTPDLNGTWEGDLCSSHFDFKESQPATLVVEQTWSKICIKGSFNHSNSSSNTTSLKINEGGGIKLLYSYYNDKDPQYYKMCTKNHRGYASLKINGDSMSGNYFNDPTNNHNHGKLNLSKQSEFLQ